jgi:cobalamin synthase
VSGLGRSLIIMGLVLVVAGLAITFASRIPWLGKLPGDIYIKKENFSFYFPLVSSILISLVLSFVFWLFKR